MESSDISCAYIFMSCALDHLLLDLKAENIVKKLPWESVTSLILMSCP